MGNEQSRAKNKTTTEHSDAPQACAEVLNSFERIAEGGNSIKLLQFQEKAGQKLCESLWKFFQKEGMEISKEEFVKHSRTLRKLAPIGIVRILMPAKNLFEVCLESSSIQIAEDETNFISSFADQLTSKGDDPASVSSWIEENCPRLLEPVFEKISELFSARSKEMDVNLKSNVLTAAQMFVLRHSLPTTLFWPKPAASPDQREDWLLLYSSTENGLSVNRFEANVFDYRGPTMAIFTLSSGEVFAVAADEEWRHSSKPFGGPNSVLFKFQPDFKRIDSTPPSLYCNFTQRTSKMGLRFGGGADFSVDGDLGNVNVIEVWGCAGSEVMAEQKRAKCRQKMQVERNARVPRGDWEENADKAILEMGGVKFSNERRDRPPNTGNLQ